MIELQSVDGSIDGGFEIVSIYDSGHLEVSILRSDPAGSAIPIGSGSGLTWSIKTYTPQITLIETQLSHRLRCLPGWETASDTLDELDHPDAVKLVGLYQTLAKLFEALYGTTPTYTTESAKTAWDSHKAKCVRYQKQAELLLRQL